MLRARQKLGKYRIERRLAEGGFATVYRALDTIEGVRVALKIPYAGLMTEQSLNDFRTEVRLTAKLDHPNILPIKDASFIDGHFVIVSPLGTCSLGDRLTSRISMRTALDYSEQVLAALAYAHHLRIIHCDVKPENYIIFPGGRLRLADFGIAKVAMRTIRASGSGTVGYVAPEQAMGKPSTCSDVFSAGLVLYRMFSGQLPEWPYQWPLPGLERARRRLRPEFIQMIRKSLEIDPRRRQQDAEQMLAQFRRLRPTALRPVPGQTPPRSRKTPRRGLTGPHWRAIRQQQFMKTFGKLLDARHECRNCAGPVAESMAFCPWCGRQRKVHRDETRFPIHCPRCRRGMKLDWRYCPWCYGAGFEPDSARRYTDRRYEGRCTNARCDRKLLMPFMRYCPWCRRKVKRKWKIPNSSDTCAACGWGVVGQFWDYCPWCGKPALTG